MSELHYDEEFKVIQKEFLEEQGENIDKMEQLLLAIENIADPKECLKDLKRIVHSLKGAAGSYDLEFASKACHFFEDHLDELERKDTADLANFFKIIDLLRSYREEILTGSSCERKFNDLLEKLRGSSVDTDGAKVQRVLIIESAKTLIKGYKLLLSSFNYDISISANGLDGFSRLMQEKFDLLITNVNTGYLSGTQLISAIKAAGGKSKDVKCILSTSNLSQIQKSDMSPDFIVEKDHSLLENLNNIVQKLNNVEDVESESTNSGPRRILCVDDDEAIQRLLELSFKSKEGVDVEQASTFDEGFAKIKSFKPDVILLDYYISGRVGTDFLTLLRVNGEEVPPVIFLTGRNKEEEVAELLKSEVSGVITKPFRPKKLYKCITDILQANELKQCG